MHRAHTDRREHDRPGHEEVEDIREEVTRVGAAVPEEVATFDCDADRPERDERKRNRRDGEPEQMTRAPVGSLRAKAPDAEVEDRRE